MPRKSIYMAGNYQQFVHFCKEHGLTPNKEIYISGVESLWGLHDVILIKIGTWYERKDAEEIERRLNLCNL
jgi:hypothetical protein